MPVKCAVCLFNPNHCVISETTFIRQHASKLDEVRRTLWIKSVHCIQKYCTIFRIPWISRKTISCTRQGRGKYFMNCRQQNRPSPCPLYCKPTNPLISRSPDPVSSRFIVRILPSQNPLPHKRMPYLQGLRRLISTTVLVSSLYNNE